MTKQSIKILKTLYREYQKRRKDDHALDCIHISKEDLDAEFVDSKIDVDAGLRELTTDGYILLLFNDDLELTAKAIKYMKRRRIRTFFEDVALFIFDVFFHF